MTNQRFVDKIAAEYHKIYKIGGYNAARGYADRIVKTDEMKREVAKKVGELMAASTDTRK